MNFFFSLFRLVFYRFFFFFTFLQKFSMSAARDVAAILGKAEQKSDKDISQCIELALAAVERLTNISGQSLHAVCSEIEEASNKETLGAAFRKLNGFTRIFSEISTAGEHDIRVREALLSLRVSERLAALLRTTDSVSGALMEYKKAVIEELAIAIRLKDSRVRLEDERDAELLALLPVPVSPLSEGEAALEPAVLRVPLHEEVSRSPRKRPSSELVPLEKISKKPKRPTFASVQQIIDGDGIGGSSQKRALMTRERLRAGEHDPRGLLDLVSTSTNALEHTKRLELLKATGYILNSKKVASDAERLNAATMRLELGLGGQSVPDTLLFGTKVLSTAGVLS